MLDESTEEYTENLLLTICKLHLIKTCAGVFPCFFANATNNGSSFFVARTIGQ